MVFLSSSGYVTAVNQISTSTLRIKCVLKVVYRAYWFIYWRSVRLAIPEGSANCHVTFSRTNASKSNGRDRYLLN